MTRRLFFLFPLAFIALCSGHDHPDHDDNELPLRLISTEELMNELDPLDMARFEAMLHLVRAVPQPTDTHHHHHHHRRSATIVTSESPQFILSRRLPSLQAEHLPLNETQPRCIENVSHLFFDLLGTPHDGRLSPVAFNQSLATILYAAMECTHSEEETLCEAPGTAVVWGATFGVTILVSLLAVFGFLLIPIIFRFPLFVCFLGSFAIGALLGDVMFHMIPEVFGEHGAYKIIGTPEKPSGVAPISPLHGSLMILLGIILTFLLDFLVEISHHYFAHKKSPEGKSNHSNLVSGELIQQATAQWVVMPNMAPMSLVLPIQPQQATPQFALQQPTSAPFVQQDPEGGHNESSATSWRNFFGYACTLRGKPFCKWISTAPAVVWMLTFSDLLHNFLDGIAIGASFSISRRLGVATSVAIIVHELAQEISDVGVLIAAGLPVPIALLFNFFSAISCILGGVIGVAAGTGPPTVYLLAITAGGFIGIAVGPIMHEVREHTMKAIGRRSWWVGCISVVGLFAVLVLGLFTLLLVSSLESHDC
jgi:zinc transporter ZupT